MLHIYAVSTFQIEVSLFIIATLFFGGRIVYSAIPYHGALSWEIDEWMRKKEIKLEHNNLFENGVEGVLMDLDEALELPEELYIVNKYQVTFDEGLRYVPGDADGDGVETGTNHFAQLRIGGEIVGFEVSLYIPELNSVTPVRYIMEPEYVSQKELDQENTMQQVDEAKDTESWMVDQSDGTMYFFFDENNGWRLAVTDAAAGSRFYVMEKTVDGGIPWDNEMKSFVC